MSVGREKMKGGTGDRQEPDDKGLWTFFKSPKHFENQKHPLELIWWWKKALSVLWIEWHDQTNGNCAYTFFFLFLVWIYCASEINKYVWL